MSGPLSEVIAALQRGARSLPEIVQTTGLSRDLVDAVVEHLVATGRLKAEPLASGCPSQACGGCVLLARGCQGANLLPVRARTLSLVNA